MSIAILKFGDFELDRARYELRRLGKPLRIEKIPMELLALLVEGRGRLVTREEIEKRLWGEDVFVDREHGVNTAIRKIRQILDDDPENPKFVQTVPKKGYRFVAEVEEVPGGIVGADAKATPAKSNEIDDLSAAHIPDSRPALPEAGDKAAQTGGNWHRWAAAAVLLIALLAVGASYAIGWRRASASKRPEIRSIAVLPLESLSGDPEQEYFADGMTDELITMLAKYKDLRVTSRTSVMRYKKARRPLPEIARELGVDAIVEGSVAHSQDRLRITAQLVYAPTDTHLWAESYDRNAEDALQVQEELSEKIAASINLASLPAAEKLQEAKVKISPEAHDAYLRGRHEWFQFNYWNSKKLFEKAAELQPNYAAAYAGLADTYTAAAVGGMMSVAEVKPKAEAAALKAVSLDDSSAEAHHALCATEYFLEWNWEKAEKECLRAIELNPNLAESHHILAYILNTQGREEEALKEDARTMELDPISRPWNYGYALIRMRRFEDAIKELRQRSEAGPDTPSTHELLSDALYDQGDLEEAFREYRKFLELTGNKDWVASLDQAYHAGGLQAALNQNFLLQKRNTEDTRTGYMKLAKMALWAGRKELATHYLQQALAARDPELVHLYGAPEFDPLRKDPRFQGICKEIGLPELKQAPG